MFRRPALLNVQHDTGRFACGKSELDSYLTDRALFNQREGYARTYVIADEHGRVAGFHALCATVLRRDAAPRQIAGHGAPVDIPAVLLARLAVDGSAQRRGLGQVLLRHAFEISVLASAMIGCRAMLVHAKDGDAEQFYAANGFRHARGLQGAMMRSMPGVAASLASAKADR